MTYIHREMQEAGTAPVVTNADGSMSDATGKSMKWWVIFSPNTIAPLPLTDNSNQTILMEGTLVPVYCRARGLLESRDEEWIDTKNLIPPIPVNPPPTPTVGSLNPQWAKIGSADVTLHVIGTNFTSASKIVFNGGEENTTYVSPTEVTTVVKPSLASVAVSVPVLVRNAGAPDSNSVNFIFYLGTSLLRLDSISPTTGVHGTVRDIACTGDGFYPDDVMMFDTTAYPVTYIYGQQVTAKNVSLGNARTASVNVKRADASRTSNSKSFTVT